jgi:hypothetical protein
MSNGESEARRLEATCHQCQEGTRTRDWYAWLDLMPPTPDHLHVTGEVWVANPGIDAVLRPHEPQGINPRILLLDLWLCQKPGVWPQIFVWTCAHYRKTGLHLRYDQVDILCDGAIIASMPVHEIH